MRLDTPVEQINNIGPKYAKKLKNLDITEVVDLLRHFPSRYEDYSDIVPIKNIKADQKITVRGKVRHVSARQAYNRRMKIIEATIDDGTGTLRAVWFNQSYLKGQLEEAQTVMLAGKTSLDKSGLYLNNPIFEAERLDAAPVHTARIVPIYPETRGVTSRWLRYIIRKLLPLAEKMDDPLPEHIIKEKEFPSIRDALINIHFPPKEEDAETARERFAFEELFYIQLAALKTKAQMKSKTSPPVKTNEALTKKFVGALPYKLTDSQKKAAWQILKDIEKKTPMNRMLEGDVGSGKTIVAAIAILNVFKNNYQAALMAPTEILAEQHYKTLTDIFKKYDIKIALYTRSHRKIAKGATEEQVSKEKIKKEIASGSIDLAIGTHALVQEKVKFAKPALVVIDEQHRFGVEQRAALVKKSKEIPHLLSMTATPIPRSLALTVYGDLDITLLREMPKGRKKIITKIVPPSKRKEAYTFIQKQLDAGRQAFVIFPLIEESEKLQSRAATQEFEKLSNGPFKNYKVALLHGKMPAKEKDEIMHKMQKGEIDILISTSVVEVGIDIPNATIMMVDGAERFGLAQLHQFRGRVGRDKHQSYAFMLTESSTASTQQRLNAIAKAKNGFELAEYDLKLRGPGSFYGVRQSGMPDLAMASLTDVKLIEEAREEATKLLEKEPQLKKYPALSDKISELQKSMHFE